MSLHLGNAAPFKEMLQQWRAIANTMSDLTVLDLNLRTLQQTILIIVISIL